MDANNWAKRIERYTKKLRAGRKYIPDMFPGISIRPRDIEQIILFGYGSSANHKEIDGAEIKTNSQLIEEVLKDIRDINHHSQAIPEQFTILRTLQLVSDHRKRLIEVLSSS